MQREIIKIDEAAGRNRNGVPPASCHGEVGAVSRNRQSANADSVAASTGIEDAIDPLPVARGTG